MQEGSLDAPERHPLDWRNPEFYDTEALDTELRRVFDICHGCRRCFNLCDSFPKLFELIDNAESGELDTVDSSGFGAVVEACTLCDMCFMTKCPYVPPHPFNLDFPHLMLRAKAQEFRRGERSLADRELAKTDRNGRLAGRIPNLANWSTRRGNRLTRPLMELAANIHRQAELPEYQGETLEEQAASNVLTVNPEAPAFGRKAVLYATCYGNYNNPEIGQATRHVLARNGVDTKVVYPGCCGMPKLENGDLEGVADDARKVVPELLSWLDQGYDIVGLTPSCVLMMKSEWPLLLPDDKDVARLAGAAFDIAEYIVKLARGEGLVEPETPIEGGVAVHLSCHSRAQNMGPKAAEMLKLVTDTELTVIERCSGHGGKWGMMKKFFETAMKIGRPAGRQLLKSGAAHVVSECPLAALHLAQIMEKADQAEGVKPVQHPIQLMARAYGFEEA